MMYYHVSKRKNLKKLKPSIPNNEMVDNYGENGTIPRISVARHIDSCLNALGGMIKSGDTLYVYLIYYDNAYKPNKSLLPDVEVTGEYWILEEVECKLCYKLKNL